MAIDPHPPTNADAHPPIRLLATADADAQLLPLTWRERRPPITPWPAMWVIIISMMLLLLGWSEHQRRLDAMEVQLNVVTHEILQQHLRQLPPPYPPRTPARPSRPPANSIAAEAGSEAGSELTKDEVAEHMRTLGNYYLQEDQPNAAIVLFALVGALGERTDGDLATICQEWAKLRVGIGPRPLDDFLRTPRDN